MYHINNIPNLSLIVAVASNNAIGKDNDLLWHISADLKRFKSLTTGHPVIMGKNTFLSLPKRPLPNRRNIVITHDASLAEQGAEVASTLQGAMRLVEGEEESFVIGGAKVYEQMLSLVSRLYVTKVHRAFEADVFFPMIDESLFRLVHETEPITDEASGLTYSYADYERIPTGMPITF